MRDKVLRTIEGRICALICGGRWAAIERRLAHDGAVPPLPELREAVGQERYQVELARDLARQLPSWVAEPSETRVDGFARTLGRDARRLLPPADNRRMAEFLLRLASQPDALASWPSDEVGTLLQRTMDSPVLLRSARFVVVALERQGGGWSWR